MSQKERLVAALLLAIAVAGGALIPRLLASPPASLGIALGPGPGRSVVQAPTILRERQRAAPRHTISPPSRVVAAPVAPVVPTTVRPKPSAGAAQPKHAPAPSPAPPATTTPPSPIPATPSPSPAAAVPAGAVEGPPGHEKTPPGQEKAKPLGHEKTPPGHEKATPPGHENTPPGHERTPPGPAGAKGPHDVPGSGHGKGSPQAPPHPVGSHHRGVGHLAPPAPRAAPPAPHARPKARPKARQPGDKGGHEPPPQVAQGHGDKRNGKP